LCQTCGKLIDSDDARFTVTLLREWKTFAEARAARVLEGRAPTAEADAAFIRLERLMPDLFREMREDFKRSPLVRQCVLLGKSWMCGSVVPEFRYFFEVHPNLQSQFQILENHGLVQSVYAKIVTRYRISEDLATYLGAP
jgi:hypothetical protein